MYHFLSILAGIFIALMVSINGELTSDFGLYSATVIFNLVALLFASVFLAAKRQSFLPNKKTPFHLYLGGAIGVATIVFNNMAFGKISVSAILALCLFGQSLTSLFFDKYGFFNMPKHPFSKMKLVGIALVMLGIVLMIINSELDALVPIILSLLTGVSVVVSRTVNAALAKHTSVQKSTFYYFAAGLIVSVAFLLILGRNEQMLVSFSPSPKVWIYTGGIIGVLAVTLLNIAVHKISSFYMTLLLFAGQVFSALVIDIVLSGSFSLNNLLGGILVTAGLVQNLLVDMRSARKQSCPAS